ncbi:MAG TPA: PAS domain S-box protein [Candidatus Saccharimonadales bacterium]|nr:PAS domain S-box protein [Candidatus Saccharimonadales bacterium]
MTNPNAGGTEEVHNQQESPVVQQDREQGREYGREHNTQRRLAIVDHAPDVFVEVDSQGLITGWNSRAEVLFGWPRSEVLGRKFSQSMVAPGSNEIYDRALEKFFTSRAAPARNRWLETIALHRDGREFPIELAAVPAHEGDALRMAAFVRDQTREKHIDQEAAERHRAIMDQLGEPYIEIDLHGKFVFVGKGYNEMFGVPAMTDRTGEHYKNIFTPQVIQLLGEVYQRIYRTGEPARVEYESLTQHGSSYFVEISASLRRDSKGRPVGFMSISNNCTRRKQAEMGLVKAKEAAETANKIKSEFLANMSHEIRTPLNGVFGMLELTGHTDLTAAQRELVDMAQSSASSLLTVINDIMDFSKIEAGELEFDLAEFDLREAVVQAVSTVALYARNKGLELSYTIAPDVPKFFLGDPRRLKQVLINLLGNAVKFTEKGAIALRVQVRKSNGPQVELQFSVSDSGIGIPPEKQTLIFEAFSQADNSTTRKFGGTGLGLAICSRIVRLMGGSIWVESEAGQGAIFHFTALLETVSHPEALPKMPDATDANQESHERFNILVAEDNLLNQKLAVKLLENLGHRVVVANDGQEALLKLEVEDFDLALMDIQMPQMDGLTATIAIRSQEQKTQAHLPIVALTAHAMKGDRERCLEVGMDGYISKPVNTNELKEIIARMRPLHVRRG